MKLGNVRTFPDVQADKAQALKPLEEAAEVYEAWKCYQGVKDDGTVLEICTLVDLLNEVADCITACCNLAAALGVEDMRPYLEAAEWRNAERGRYE